MMTVSDFMTPVVVLLLLILLVVGVGAVVARVGGWYALSKQYPRPPEAAASESSPFASGKVGGAYYRAALIVGVSADGVFLSCVPPSNVGAPPLFIPWRALRFVARSKLLWEPQLHLETEDGTRIELSGRAANLVDRAGPWPS